MLKTFSGESKDLEPVIRTGRIEIWDDAKGFGWIGTESGRLFFHEREFAGKRLEVGAELEFWEGKDLKGRPCARSPMIVAVNHISPLSWVLLGSLLVLPILGLMKVPVEWWWPLAQVTALSTATYFLYGYDKRQAVRGGWRVPETSLHLGELAGGWPGAFLAQRRMRHKNAKGRYQIIFWCILLLHQIVGLDFFLNNHLSKELWTMMGEGKIF